MNKLDRSGSHLPILSFLLFHSKGDVIELGAGFNSTPLLYWTCKAFNRNFESYENDKKWCEKLGGMSMPIDDWDSLDFTNKHYSIALIDHRPAIRRKTDAIRLKDHADFVVMHDSEAEINKFYQYTRVYPHFKYRYDFDKYKPNTTILSNTVDLKKLFQDFK